MRTVRRASRRGRFAATPKVASATATASDSGAPAPGSPGSESYFDLARKDCVGTAMNTTSKVWFTVADGVLSDTYWPTVDATNVNSLQYVVTDGHSFTDLQTRDMTYTVQSDPTGMACTIVASSSAHHYRIVTTYLADPAARRGAHARPLRGPEQRSRLRAARPAGRRHRWRRLAERGRQLRIAGQLRRPDRARRRQHQHHDRRRQPQLRGPDLHGARDLGRLRQRERRLRRQRQRRALDARQRLRADAL